MVKSNTLFLTIEKELNIVDQNMLQITQNESSQDLPIVSCNTLHETTIL